MLYYSYDDWKYKEYDSIEEVKKLVDSYYFTNRTLIDVKSYERNWDYSISYFSSIYNEKYKKSGENDKIAISSDMIPKDAPLDCLNLGHILVLYFDDGTSIELSGSNDRIYFGDNKQPYTKNQIQKFDDLLKPIFNNKSMKVDIYKERDKECGNDVYNQIISLDFGDYKLLLNSKEGLKFYNKNELVKFKYGAILDSIVVPEEFFYKEAIDYFEGKMNDNQQRIYNIVEREVNKLDPMGLISFCPDDEYSGEIDEVFNLIVGHHELEDIEKAMYDEFAYNFENIHQFALCDQASLSIYKRIHDKDELDIYYHRKVDDITLTSDVPDEAFEITDDIILNLKEGDICRCSDIFMGINSNKVGSNYADDLNDKVDKITDEDIIFSNNTDQYSNQSIVHYYNKKSGTFYCLEHCGNFDRWVVFQWRDNNGILNEGIIDWFTVEGSLTPQHIIYCAKICGVI